MPPSKTNPEKTRCLGLLGGLGVGAAVHYYQYLALAAESESRELDLVMAHARTARVFGYVDASDPQGLANYLNGFLIRLKAAGAELAVIPAVTHTIASANSQPFRRSRSSASSSHYCESLTPERFAESASSAANKS